VLDIEHMLATEPPPIPWVVEPLLVSGCVTMLAGREGQGKSMLALALASAIGHGATVAGLDCEPGRMLYVDAENGEREAHRRVRGLGVKPGTLIYVEAQGFNLAADIELVAVLVDEHKPSVLVLDSLRSLAPGLDENDSKQAEAAVRPVSRLAQARGIPVLMLHHAGKNGVEYRGSTAIGAAVELGFTLSRHEEDPDKRTRRKLACWKSRPAPEPDVRWLSLEASEGRILIGEADPDKPERERPRDNLRDDVLDVIDGERMTAAAIAKALGRAKNDGTIRRVLQDLENEEVLDRDDAGLWGCQLPDPPRVAGNVATPGNGSK
jgi:predicted ATP-dependent serine protease